MEVADNFRAQLPPPLFYGTQTNYFPKINQIAILWYVPENIRQTPQTLPAPCSMRKSLPSVRVAQQPHILLRVYLVQTQDAEVFLHTSLSLMCICYHLLPTLLGLG